MKKLIYLLFLSLVCAFQQVKAQEVKTAKTSAWDNFYKFLAENIKYPEKAKVANAQGNSVVLLTISKGQLKKFTVTNANPELGFDAEVTQKLFAYPGFKESKSGNYALITSYRIADSKSPINNKDYIIPKGYSPLKLVIMGYGINKVTVADTAKNNSSTDHKSFKVLFRGVGTADLNAKNPIYIVNDEVVEDPLINTIDPKNIESISILKDASAMVKYGQEAKNGVILIFTKDYTPKKTVKK